MNALGGWLSTLDGPSAAFLELVARVTALLSLAWAAHLTLGRANPRWRILLWRAAGVGVLGVAGLSLAPSLFSLPVLPADALAESRPAHEDSMTRLERPAALPPIVRVDSSDAPRVDTPAATAASMPRQPIPPARSAGVDRPDASSPRARPMTWLLLIWGTGVACGASRMFVGAMRARAIRRSSAAVPEWIEAEAARIVGERLAIEVRAAAAVSTPCGVGFFGGAILLPDGLCVEARTGEVRAALAHEAAHFRGIDLPWNHLLQAVAVLLWFHPLAWRVRLAHADACDERCDADAAARLGDPIGYGRALARIALAVSGPTPPAVLAMARRARVSRRIEAVVRGGTAPLLGRRSAAAAVGAAAMLALASGTTGLAPSHAEEKTPPAAPAAEAGDAATPPADEAAEQAVTADEVEKAEQAVKLVRIVDPKDRPVAGATVVPWAIRSRAGHGLWTPKGQGGGEPPVVTTDADGVARIPLPEFAYADERIPIEAVTCRVEHPDFAETMYNDVPVAGEQRDRVTTVTVKPGALVEVVATEDGRPLGPENLFAMTGSPSGRASRPLSRGPDGTLRLPRLPAGGDMLRVVRLRGDGPPTFGEVHRLDLDDGGSVRVEATLRPGVDVRGRLAETVPRPIRDGRVIAEVLEPGEGVQSLSWRTWARINPDGTFRLGDFPPGELQVIALCDGYMAASGDRPAFAAANDRGPGFSRPQVFPIAGETAEIVLAMTPTAEAAVRVVGPDGGPVAGAEVGFWPNVKWWGGGSQIYASPLYRTAEMLKQGEIDWAALRDDRPFSATTGDDGTAVVSNLPPGDQSFTVRHETLEMAAGDDPGLRSARIEAVGGRRSETTVTLHPKGTQPLGEAPEPPAGRRADEATVIPKPRPPRVVEAEAAETELAGVVLDEIGNPIEGVEVDAWTWHPGNETKTDAEGRFLLKGFDANEAVEVEFRKDGYSPSLFIGQKAGTDDWTVLLTQGTWLEGTVSSPDGEAVPGALVRAFRGPFRNPGVVIGEVWSETKAGGDGTYRLHLEAGTYDVQVRQPGIGVVRHQKVTLAAKEKKRLDLDLEEGVTFRANVRDSETGAPVEGINLWNWRQSGIEGTSDENGVLEITGMSEGEFEFGVTAKGADRRRTDVAGEYARWWSPSAVHEHQREEPEGEGFRRNFDDLTFLLGGETFEAEVFVEPAVTITGRVVDPDGKPVAGATVAPAKTGSGNSLTGDTRFSRETDADGRFELKLPASGEAEYNLIAHDGKYGEWRTWANGFGDPFRTTPGERIEDVELDLNRPATVRGRVTDSLGRPRRNVEVRAASTDKRDNRYYVPTTKTDDDGNYELKFVASGQHHVQIAPFWLAADQAPGQTTQVVEVEEGETVEGVDFKAD